MLLGMNADIGPESLANNRIDHEDRQDETGNDNYENDDDPAENLMQVGDDD